MRQVVTRSLARTRIGRRAVAQRIARHARERAVVLAAVSGGRVAVVAFLVGTGDEFVTAHRIGACLVAAQLAIATGLAIGERRAQEGLLLSADILRDAVRPDPVVVCGDFNYWWGGPVPALVRRAIHDASHLTGCSTRTYPTRFPLFRLDRIFVDDGVKPGQVFAHRSALSAVASDHLPLVMDFSVA